MFYIDSLNKSLLCSRLEHRNWNPAQRFHSISSHPIPSKIQNKNAMTKNRSYGEKMLETKQQQKAEDSRIFLSNDKHLLHHSIGLYGF